MYLHLSEWIHLISTIYHFKLLKKRAEIEACTIVPINDIILLDVDFISSLMQALLTPNFLLHPLDIKISLIK
jgi:hypothetical protein